MQYLKHTFIQLYRYIDLSSKGKNDANLIIGIFFAIVGTACFSVKSIFIKLAYAYDVSATELLTLRMVFALPFFIAAAIYFEKRATSKLTKSDIFKIFFAGFSGYYLASLLDFIGLTYIEASLERLILYTYPIFVMAMTGFANKLPTPRIFVAGTAITYCGLAALFLQGDVTWSNHYLLGGFFVLLSAFTYALYLVVAGKVIPSVGASRFNAYAMSISCIIVIIQYLATPNVTIFHHTPEVYQYGLLLAFVSTVIPSFMVMSGIGRIGASMTAFIGIIGPIFTIFAAFVFLGESMSINQLFGAVLIFMGVYLVGKSKKLTKTTSSPTKPMNGSPKS